MINILINCFHMERTEEKEAISIVKSILTGICEPDMIFYRERKYYVPILYNKNKHARKITK